MEKIMVEIFLFFFSMIANDGKHHADRREWLWKFGLFLIHINSDERIMIKRCSSGKVCLFRATKMTKIADDDGGG